MKALRELQDIDIIIFLDSEYTCWEDSVETGWADPSYPMEVIQIGLALFDVQGKRFIEKYSRYVRPTTNPILSQYCKNLLQIKQTTIDEADDCLTVFDDISKLLDNYTNNNQSMLTCSWGTDRKVLGINATRNFCPDPFTSLPSIDLAVVATDIFCKGHGHLVREKLRTMLGLQHPTIRHDALADALDVKTLLDALLDLDL